MDKELFQLFLRQLVLEEVGWEGQEKICKAKVLVVGAGGIGCPAVTYLLRSGVGRLGIADFDKVDVTNIHRQFLYDVEDKGRLKTEVLVSKIKKYSFQEISAYSLKVNGDNLNKIVQGYDVILDGTDNFSTRYAVNDVCAEHNKPLVTASILGFGVQLFVFGQPKEKNLRSIFPVPPDPRDVPSCSENGVLGPVAGMAGTMAAMEVLKWIIGKKYLKDEFVVADFLNWDIQKIKY